MRNNTRALTCAVVAMCSLVAYADPLATADELLATRESFVGRAFINPNSVAYAYEEGLDKANAQWGKKSLQSAEARMMLGHASVDEWERRTLYQQALSTTRDAVGENHPLYGRYLLEAASGLIDADAGRSGRRFLDDAEQWYSARAPQSNLELAQIAFYRGISSENRSRKKNAVEFYAQSAAIAASQSPTSDVLQDLMARAHGEALRILETGNKRDEATVHVLALARLGANGGDAMPRQLFMVPPPYSRSLLRDRSQGTVTFEITIDEAGLVRNPSIVEIDGPPEFGNAVLQVIDSWRFTPRIKNGEAVSARLRNQYFFTTEEATEP
ncbi:MAG: energy transducer TonB [Gammaproteobacteria bacterium]